MKSLNCSILRQVLWDLNGVGVGTLGCSCLIVSVFTVSVCACQQTPVLPALCQASVLLNFEFMIL